MRAVVSTKESRFSSELNEPKLVMNPLLHRKRYSPGYCAMYGIRGTRSDGKALNYLFGRPSVKVISSHQKSKVCVPQFQGTVAVQRFNLSHCGPKFSKHNIFVGQVGAFISTTVEHVIAPDVRYVL
ncbi:hypothetical protein Dimus_013351 [Dionaea muscipula]